MDADFRPASGQRQGRGGEWARRRPRADPRSARMSRSPKKLAGPGGVRHGARLSAAVPGQPSSSSVQSIGSFGSSESRTEQYLVSASSIARSAWVRSIPAPRSR